VSIASSDAGSRTKTASVSTVAAIAVTAQQSDNTRALGLNRIDWAKNYISLIVASVNHC
jgi:hypothetical protein